MKKKSVPSLKELCESTALYAPVEIQPEDTRRVIELLYLGGVYDAYCVECRREATFKVTAGNHPGDTETLLTQIAYITSGKTVKPSIFKNGAYMLKGECTRATGHYQSHIIFISKVSSPTIFDTGSLVEKYFFQKIGQYPSTADLSMDKTKRYASILNKEQMREFNKAIGLASHGVGVGAFVYMRRIFEDLIEQAHQGAANEKSWKESAYQKARMGERIKLLKNVLPEFLVDNHQIYALMSKGVHELSESECIEHFQTVRVCIELILDEKISERERKKKIESARVELTKSIAATKGRVPD